MVVSVGNRILFFVVVLTSAWNVLFGRPNLVATPISFDTIIKKYDGNETTANNAAVNTGMSAHCLFIVQRLWGDHDSGRSAATIQWYKEATIRSIEEAVLISNDSGYLTLVEVHLVTNNTYSEPWVKETITAARRERSDTNKLSIVYSNHTDHLKAQISSNQCEVVSFMRLDCDDMLMANALQHVAEGWQARVSMAQQYQDDQHTSWLGKWRNKKYRRCSLADTNCPYVMLTGTTSLATLNVAAGDSNDDRPNCFFKLNPRNDFFSQGLTVTMPTSTWNMHFGGDMYVVYIDVHDLMLRNLKKKLKEHRIHVWPNNVQDHAVFMHTSLSSHYQANRTNATLCDTSYLRQRLDEASVAMVEDALAWIPELSENQRDQNTFIQRYKELGHTRR